MMAQADPARTLFWPMKRIILLNVNGAVKEKIRSEEAEIAVSMAKSVQIFRFRPYSLTQRPILSYLTQDVYMHQHWGHISRHRQPDQGFLLLSLPACNRYARLYLKAGLV